MDTKAIAFGGTELLLLEKALKFDSERAIFQSRSFQDGEMTDLILKVAHAIVNAKEDTPIDMSLTMRECWFYREAISIFDKVGNGSPSEGFTIKTKLYDAILEFELENHADEVPQLGIPTTEEVEYARSSTDETHNAA